MTTFARHVPPGHLTIPRGASLYTGALLGPGLLLLPGLAAAEAGPAAIVAWLALLALSGLFAAVFSALGRGFPSAGGVIGYVAAGLGRRSGLVSGWWFLAGVVAGAPIVCLIGASYITGLTGGGRLARTLVAAMLLLAVLILAAAGLRATARAQLVLVSLLIAVIAVAVVGAAPSARAANWAPFAPHGWLAVGHAATTLMLSFVGWEAVAPLTTRFASPARQLPRVVAAALAATTTLYLSLAVAITGVLGAGAASPVPLADLLRHAIGTAGPAVAAVAAAVLTLGTVNAYVAGASAMARELRGPAPAAGEGGPARGFLAVIAAAGLLLLTLYGCGLTGTASMVAVPTSLFLCVYLASMVSAARVLRGAARAASAPAALAVLAMLAYCGWVLAVPAAVALAAAVAPAAGRRTAGPAARSSPSSPPRRSAPCCSAFR